VVYGFGDGLGAWVGACCVGDGAGIGEVADGAGVADRPPVVVPVLGDAGWVLVAPAPPVLEVGVGVGLGRPVPPESSEPVARPMVVPPPVSLPTRPASGFPAADSMPVIAISANANAVTAPAPSTTQRGRTFPSAARPPATVDPLVRPLPTDPVLSGLGLLSVGPLPG
jgi:hypothetical protein